MALKIILSDCFAGEEREIDPRKTKIIEGFEVDDTRVELADRTVLICREEGRYHTLGRPQERWAEALEVKASPDGSYTEGEVIGYVRLPSPKPQGEAPRHTAGAPGRAHPLPPRKRKHLPKR